METKKDGHGNNTRENIITRRVEDDEQQQQQVYTDGKKKKKKEKRHHALHEKPMTALGAAAEPVQYVRPFCLARF